MSKKATMKDLYWTISEWKIFTEKKLADIANSASKGFYGNRRMERLRLMGKIAAYAEIMQEIEFLQNSPN